MPQGHELLTPDPQAEAAFAGQYGIHPNAEALLAAHRANLDPALEAALLKPVDEEATAELDLNEIDAGDDKVVTAAVRGGVIVYLAEGADGRRYKGVQPVDESYESPEDPAAKAVRASEGASSKFSKAAATVNANIEKKVEEYRQELNEQAAEALTGVREDLDQEAAEAAEEAQAEAEASAEGDTAEAKPKARAKKDEG